MIMSPRKDDIGFFLGHAKTTTDEKILKISKQL